MGAGRQWGWRKNREKIDATMYMVREGRGCMGGRWERVPPCPSPHIMLSTKAHVQNSVDIKY